MRRRAEPVLEAPAVDPYAARLEELAGRTAVVAQRPRVRAAFFRAFAGGGTERVAGLEFVTLEGGDGPAILMVEQGSPGGRRLALATPLQAVIERYWSDADLTRRWRVGPRSELRTATAAHELPPCFGRLALLPSEETLARLAESSRRRVVLLVTVTVGTAAAWAVVIWLMIGVLSHQRELVKLQRRFMADVSHELKTPLALIRLLAETLVEGRLRDPQRVGEYHRTISRESERLTRLLDNILDFSRIESGRKQYEFTECDVGEVAQQAWELFAPRFAAEGFTADLHVADDLPALRADPQSLSQVFINLLQNAYRYRGDEKYISCAVVREDDEIVMRVSDRGIGMSRTQIRRLGRSFERGSDPRVRRTRGTGLGLAITQHIIQAHEGTLEVRSEIGRGSTFTVRLPIRPPE